MKALIAVKFQNCRQLGGWSSFRVARQNEAAGAADAAALVMSAS
jgi:hypothetical protein